jgi:GNAT superfamily N-acetyltransferase
MPPGKPKLKTHPVTPRRWDDFAKLFGSRGACGGCWCMWWRLTSAEFEKRKGAGNRRAMRTLVKSGRVPGLLAYRGREPVGWISVAPRDDFPRLATSRILKPVDDEPVWSVVCFFVAKEHRGQGVSVELLRAAIDFVRRKGGRMVEGYPVEPRKKRAPAVFVYTGLAAAYRQAGFRECARRSATRPIMRYVIK